MIVPVWSTACLDWERRILARESLVPFPPLFPSEAEAALKVFKTLRVVDAPGSPTMGEACRPWITDFVSAVFGSYNPETGRRMINEYLLCVSKKNSKSTLAAGIMLTALIRNWRNSAEFLILAPTIEVANNSFIPARDMVAADDELRDLLQVQESWRVITNRVTRATLRVIAADNETVGGKKATGVLVDELWLFGKRANAENMLREATGGRASRPEGFTIYLTTQSDEPPVGIWKQTLNDFRDIRDGKLVDNKRLPLLYEFPPRMIEDKSYKDRSNFFVTNPNLGASVDEEFLQDEYTKAERAGVVSFAGFAAKHLNVEIGMGLRTDRWVGADYWQERTVTGLSLADVLDRSECVVVGIDGGGLDDLFGFAVLGREKTLVDVKIVIDGVETVKKAKRWLLWTHGWCHEGVLERRKAIAATLRDFADAGELTIVDDELVDTSEIVARIEKISDRGLLGGVAVDPAGIGELVDMLKSIGVTEENKLLCGVRQGVALMPAIKTAERRLASGALLHSDDGLMAWNVANVKIEPQATSIRATKANAGDAKIDLAMAMFNAIVVMSDDPNPNRPRSVYEERELLVL